jgi:hypothetical protein
MGAYSSNIAFVEWHMNSKWSLAWLAIVLGSLSGCASMSSDECMASDWTAVGYEDGSRGYNTDRFGQHRKACAKHGVTADFSAYQIGRDQGLVEYCQPYRGFSVGSNGGSYSGVCNVSMEPDFLEAYNVGRNLYTLRSNVNRANSGIRSRENELDKIEDQLVQKATALIADETSSEDRIILLAEMRDLAGRTGQLQAQIKELYDVRARNQVELEHYQLAVADMGY